MATRFEIVLHGGDSAQLRAAGEEALDEIDRIEAQLSLYKPGSEVARLNAEAHRQSVRVTPGLFRLLERANELSRETKGAFDLTIAPLVRCWGFMGGTGSMPSSQAIAEARQSVGIHLVELDQDRFTVRFKRAGVMLDFGAIGKGYAVDCAVDLLREAGVPGALIHGGTSTTYALGRQPDNTRWKVGITSPKPGEESLAVVELENESLSVSARWGRSFSEKGVSYGHVIDPRTGEPADKAVMSAMTLPSATESDALSTALLTDPELKATFIAAHPRARCMVVRGSETGLESGRISEA